MTRFTRIFRTKPRTELEEHLYNAERSRIQCLAMAEEYELAAAQQRLQVKHYDGRIARIRAELEATAVKTDPALEAA